MAYYIKIPSPVGEITLLSADGESLAGLWLDSQKPETEGAEEAHRHLPSQDGEPGAGGGRRPERHLYRNKINTAQGASPLPDRPGRHRFCTAEGQSKEGSSSRVMTYSLEYLAFLVTQSPPQA